MANSDEAIDPLDESSESDGALPDHEPTHVSEPVPERRRQSSPGNDFPEGSAAAQIIARRRSTKNLPWFLFLLSLGCNMLQPVAYMRSFAARREVVLMDSNSNLLVSPLLDPMSSGTIQQVCFTWAAKGLLDRNPEGFANPVFLESYFTQAARERAQADWAAQEQQAKQKQIFQDYAPFNFQLQAREGNLLRVRVDGQLRVQGRDNGLLVTEPRAVAIEMTFAENPNMGNNRFFPLIVQSFRFLGDPMPIPGT